MARILVTGGTGFLGSHLLPRLGRQHTVFALIRDPSIAAEIDGVEWIRQDLAEPLRRNSLPDQIDAVVHLAQSRHYREFPEQARDIFRVNVQSTVELLEYARLAGARRFVFASSGGVYETSYERLTEEAPINPLNFYLTTKYTSELFLSNYRCCFSTVVLRFFFLYGPGQRRMLVPTLLERIRRRETIVIQGKPGIRTTPIYIDDAVAVFEPVLSLEGSGLFNIAGNEAVTLTELVHLCGEALGETPRIEYDLSQNPGDMVAANDRMKETLGVVPSVSLQEGLSRCAEALLIGGLNHA